MKIKKIAALYALFMGISIIGMWLMFYITNSIPEIQTKPIELGLHIAAELCTAVLLIVGGVGLLTRRTWGLNLYLLSMGMLLYTLIMSPGYFAQRGEYSFVIMFSVFTLIAIVLIVRMIRMNINRGQ